MPMTPIVSSRDFIGMKKNLNICQCLRTRTRRFTVGIGPLCNRHLMGGNINVGFASSPNLEPPIFPAEKYKGRCIKNL